MTMYEIKNLDCSKKEHRKILVKHVMQILKLEEKPTKEELKYYCAKLKKKYNVKTKNYSSATFEHCYIMDTGDGYILTCFYNSEYEGYLKYIFLVYYLVKSGKLKKVT